MTASKVDTPTLVVENRGGTQRWCVVHAGAGQAVLFALRSRKAAEAARLRLRGLPIHWETETIERPAFGSPDNPHVYLPARTITRLVDAASRSILLGEQTDVLGA